MFSSYFGRIMAIMAFFMLVSSVMIVSVHGLDNEHFQPLHTLRRQIQQESDIQSVVLSETHSTQAPAGACTYGGQLGQCTSTSLPCTGVRFSGLCFGAGDIQCCLPSNQAKFGVYGNEKPKVRQTSLIRLSETQHREKWTRFKNLYKPTYVTPAAEQEAYLNFRENRIQTVYLNDRYGGGNVVWSSATPFAAEKASKFAATRLSKIKPSTLQQVKSVPIMRSFMELSNQQQQQVEQKQQQQDEHWVVFQRLVKAIEQSEKDQGIDSDLTTLIESTSSSSSSSTSTSSIQGIGSSKVGGELSVDYRNFMQPVRDSRGCEAAWAYTSVETMEGSAAKNGMNVKGPLSAEWFNLCDQTDIQQACRGGMHIQAFDDATRKVVASESEMRSFLAADVCPAAFANGGTGGIKVKEIQRSSVCTYDVDEACPQTDEANILQHLKTFGPISIGIDGTNLQNYMGGILPIDSCDSGIRSMNHFGTIIGFGTENGQDFWLVRNSYGPAWGEEGNIRLRANIGKPGNACGLGNLAFGVTVVAA